MKDALRHTYPKDDLQNLAKNAVELEYPVDIYPNLRKVEIDDLYFEHFHTNIDKNMKCG